MADLPSVFANIINFNLSLLISSYNLPVNDCHRVEYSIYVVDSLD